jgi:hypothetical protein
MGRMLNCPPGQANRMSELRNDTHRLGQIYRGERREHPTTPYTHVAGLVRGWSAVAFAAFVGVTAAVVWGGWLIPAGIVFLAGAGVMAWLLVTKRW